MSKEVNILPTLNIGIIIYDGFDSLDVAGPNQVFYFMKNLAKDMEINLYQIGLNKGKVKSLEGLTWVLDYDFQTDIELDVIFVPGGAGNGLNNLIEDLKNPFYDFIKKQAESAKLITSVCTGALLLARAGLLDGYTCTTHWAFKQPLSLFPNLIVAPGFPRYVIDRDRITGGGISSGIDEALAIVEVLHSAELSKKIQLSIQYAPKPPNNSGDPSVAPPSILYEVSNGMATGKMSDLIKKALETSN